MRDSVIIQPFIIILLLKLGKLRCSFINHSNLDAALQQERIHIRVLLGSGFPGNSHIDGTRRASNHIVAEEPHQQLRLAGLHEELIVSNHELASSITARAFVHEHFECIWQLTLREAFEHRDNCIPAETDADCRAQRVRREHVLVHALRS